MVRNALSWQGKPQLPKSFLKTVIALDNLQLTFSIKDTWLETLLNICNVAP
jgi:hypothetical protein